MIKNSTLLSNLSPEELGDMIGKTVKIEFNNFQNSINKSNLQDELLTREEASEFLKIDLSTLWHWTNNGKIKAYAIGSRRYYKKTELLDSLKPLMK